MQKVKKSIDSNAKAMLQWVQSREGKNLIKTNTKKKGKEKNGKS